MGGPGSEELGECACADVFPSLQPEYLLCLPAAHPGETAVGTGTVTALPNGMALPSPSLLLVCPRPLSPGLSLSKERSSSFTFASFLPFLQGWC